MVELRDPYTRELRDGRTLKPGDKVLVIDTNAHSGDTLTLFALVTKVEDDEDEDAEHLHIGLVCKPFNPDTDL